MSPWREANPTNPQDDLDTLTSRLRGPGERPETRFAAAGGSVHESRPGSLRSTVTAGDPLESAMSEFARRRFAADAVPPPADLSRAGTSRMASAIGLAAAIAVACFAALLFVTLFPGERDPLQAFAAAAPPRDAIDASTRQPAREIDAANGDTMSMEQSDRLLRQFVQWRQKVAVTEKQ
jgi:hypothetical protein